MSVGVVAFVDALRRVGVDVPVDASATFAAALTHVDVASGDDVYWAGRSTLVRDPGDFDAYDTAFVEHFGRVPPAATRAATVPVTVTTDDGDDASQGPVPGDRPPSIEVRYSSAEVLRHADLARLDPDELAQAHRLVDRMRLAPRPRPSSRRRRGSGPGARPDISATVRAALRTDTEPLRVITSSRSARARRVVLLVDVSGSMEPYARALLRFAAAAVRGRRGVEVFALGTRLTRLTRSLDHHDPDRALDEASRAVDDFGGGTRLGDGVAEFNDTWGIRGLARGAIVVILSDGWDRGDPARLGEQMRRLSLVAHRVVWVNPLRASPGYQPLAAGMAAALDHVDAFVDGHSVSSLADLADLLARDFVARS